MEMLERGRGLEGCLYWSHVPEVTMSVGIAFVTSDHLS
jgi:hypothetical protein